MVQVTGDKVIRVVAMRNGLVAAVQSMRMAGVVAFAIMTIGAGGRVLCAYLKPVLIDVAFVRVVEVAIVQKVSVPVVLNGRVAAIGFVLMGVVLVDRMLFEHARTFLLPLQTINRRGEASLKHVPTRS